jgi:molybdenum cofactor biosynthesis enzyme MoaA
MANLGHHPEDDQNTNLGWLLTFIVPAFGGCNFRCGFCLIRQRREINDKLLYPDAHVIFIREIYERAKISALAIQGHEPLLPASIPCTFSIITTGHQLRLPTSLITNGFMLTEAIPQLKETPPRKLCVSLDAVTAETHDHVRRTKGAWAKIVKGIELAAKELTHTSLAVISVLTPNQRQRLDGMPRLLKDLGVNQWILSPLMGTGPSHKLHHLGDPRSFFCDVQNLQEAAKRAGVQLTIDDELGQLKRWLTDAGLPPLGNVRSLPSTVKIARLTANGQCSIGQDILCPVTAETPRWLPGEVHAGEFLEQLQPSSSLKLERRKQMPPLPHTDGPIVSTRC